MALKIKRGQSANLGTLTLAEGEPAFALDTGKLYIGNGTDKVLINPDAATSGVQSVNGKTGPEVTLVKDDVGLDNVDNTADSAKAVLSATKLTTARTINGVSFDGSANITVADATKEPAITAGTVSQFWSGTKTWRDLATDVRAVVLTGLSTATNAVISATDTLLVALGKLQKQITDNLATLTAHTGNTSNPHSVTKAQVGLGSVDNTADAAKNVLSATKLTTARTISLAGDATGSASFDGSANKTITVTIANVDGGTF